MKPSTQRAGRGRRSKPVVAGRAEPIPTAPRSWASPGLLAGLLLLLAVVLVYQPVAHAGYIWDDDLLLTANPCVVGPLGLKEVWTTTQADLCPLTITAFWAEHKLWNLAPVPYHLVNVLLHALCALLLWRLLRLLRVPGAWLGAALWALHPVQVESVAWIAEMKNTLSGVFYLLAVLFFVRSLGPPDLDGRTDRGRLVALTWLCAALAMAGKTSTMVLPVVLGLLAWWQEGRWRRRTLLELGPVFLLALAAGAISLATAGAQEAADAGASIAPGWPQRLVISGDAVWFYLGKLVWPHPLMMVYPRWEADPRWWAFLPLLAVGIVLLVLWRQRRPWTAVGLVAFGYFLVVLLPVLGLVQISDFRHSFVFDHFLYLASMGPLALAGAGVASLLARFLPGREWGPSVVGAGLLLILGTLSWQRVWVYEGQQTLWTDTLAKNPGCWVAANNLGLALLHRGRFDEAILRFQQALKIEPANARSHSNLGNALRQEGRLDEAMGQYLEALKLKPDSATDHNNLGITLRAEGRVDEAIVQYQEALQVDPGNALTRNNLGNALLQKGQVDKAIVQYQIGLKINPDQPLICHDLGILLAKRGRLGEAMVQLRQALRLKPDYAEAEEDLATVQQAMARQAGRGD